MKDQKDTAAGDPEATAIAALGWLAQEPELLSRFLALSGIEPAHMRHAAGDPAFLWAFARRIGRFWPGIGGSPVKPDRRPAVRP